jgi:hypothetical protein
MSWVLIAILAAGCTSMNGQGKSKSEKEEGNETKIKFSEAPAPVQKTLTDQAGGAKIDTVDKETTKDGKTVYEADAVINGTNYEIVVGADGQLIKKAVDKEEDEKDKKD